MRILIFHDSKLPPKGYGGIERMVVVLAEEYSRRGHEVSVLCKKGSQLPAPIRVIEIPENWNGRNVEEIIPSEIEFIHSQQPLTEEPKRPYLVTIHGNGHPGENYWSNTNFLSQSHARNHHSSIYIYNGVDVDRFKYEDQKENYFIFLARTTWRVKNLKTAITWASDLGVDLKIIGGNGISRGHIQYLGFVEDAEKNRILGKAKALIYPTNWDEPCASAPLEALACGTPVITTANGCMPELIDAKTGVVCKSYDELLKAPAKISALKPSDCRARAETIFSLKRMAGEYLTLIERIMKSGKLVAQDARPRYNFRPESVQLMFKPTLVNRARVMLTGKI